MNIWSAPIFTFFSRPFYRLVARSPLSRGVLYMLYLSVVLVLVLIINAFITLVPVSDRFVEWMKQDMPQLMWTDVGLTMKQPSPYTMVHPELGPIVSFDLNKTKVDPKDMENLYVLVTHDNIYVHQNQGIRVYSLAQMQPKNMPPGTVAPIDQTAVDKYYGTVKGAMVVAALLMGIPFIFCWKLLVAFVFSLFALIFNTMRQSRLPYSRLYLLTLFAMTPAIVFQILRTLIPILSAIPAVVLVDMGITVGFVYFAVKMSEEPLSPGIQPPLEA